MSLLAKLNKEKIQTKFTLSENDKQVCEDLQKEWRTFFSYATQYMNFIRTHQISTGTYNNKHDLPNMRLTISNQLKTFITNVIKHFEQTYGISLNKYTIIQKYGEDTSINYTTVLDEILKQIGGPSFKEKAFEEIKEKAQNTVKHKDVYIKKRKILLSNFIFWDEYSSEKRLNTDNKQVKEMFIALSHFISGESALIRTLQHFFWELDSFGYSRTKFHKKFVCSKKVLTIKVFKNGKVEIDFETSEYAKEFAKEYLGYTTVVK